MASELIIDLGAPADNPNSQQPEHLTIAVIESEHRVATETHLGSDSMEQQQGAGEAAGSPDRIRAEEQKGETNREVSETIQKLDSMLLEAGGEVTVPLEKIQESSLLVSIGETPESVGEPVLVLPDKVSEDNNESEGETLLVVIPGSGEEACKSGEETSKSGGETLLVEIHGSEVTSKSGEETSKSEGGTLLVEIQESGEVTSKSGEDTSRLGEQTLLVVIPGSAEEPSKSVEVFSESGGKSSKLEGETSQLGGKTLLVEIPGSEETSKSEGGTLLVEVIDLVKETSKVEGETLLVEIPGSGEEASKSEGGTLLVEVLDLVKDTSKVGGETLLVEIPGSEETSKSGGETLLVEIPGPGEETSKSGEPSESPLKRRQSELQKSLSVDGPVVVVVPIESNHEVPSSPAPPAEVKKGPSYAEANGNNIIIIEHGSILRRSAPAPGLSSTPAEPLRSSPAALRRSTPADLCFSRSSSGSSPLPNHDSPSSPFQVLSSPSSRSLLEREIEEVQQRESELRRQRSSIYGKDYSEEDSPQRTPQNRDDILSGVYQPERPNWGKLEVNWPPNRGSALNGEADQASDSPRTRRQRSALIQSWESGNPSPREEP